MMLLVDNLEQVIDASPDRSGLAEKCPNLTIMVTSRELMKIRGERPRRRYSSVMNFASLASEPSASSRRTSGSIG